MFFPCSCGLPLGAPAVPQHRKNFLLYFAFWLKVVWLFCIHLHYRLCSPSRWMNTHSHTNTPCCLKVFMSPFTPGQTCGETTQLQSYQWDLLTSPNGLFQVYSELCSKTTIDLKEIWLRRGSDFISLWGFSFLESAFPSLCPSYPNLKCSWIHHSP